MTDKQKESWANSREERQAQGKALREQASWNKHGEWAPAAGRPDPISLLQAQDVSRVQHLVPIKYGRMVESAFAFLRGSAVVMATASPPAAGICHRPESCRPNTIVSSGPQVIRRTSPSYNSVDPPPTMGTVRSSTPE